MYVVSSETMSAEVTFAVWDFLIPTNVTRVNYDVFTYKSESTRGVWNCDLKFIAKSKELLKVTAQTDNISDTAG